MNRLGRAMADPTRSRILLTLLQGPAYPAELAGNLGLTRSNVARALSSLIEVSLAVNEKAPCLDSACLVPGCGDAEGAA